MNTIRTRLQSLMPKIDNEKITNTISELLDAGTTYSLTESELTRISLEKLSAFSKDANIKQFLVVESRLRKLFDMGIYASAEKILNESDIRKFPNIKSKFDWFLTSAEVKPDYLLVEGYLSLLNENRWDGVVESQIEEILKTRNELSEDIMIKSTIDSIKTGNNKFMYEGIIHKLETYLITKTNESRKLITEELSKYKFDARLNSLCNNLKLVENNMGGFNLIDNDARCTVTPVISPVKITESWDYFVVNGNYFRKNGKVIKKINEESAQKWAPEVVKLNSILSAPGVRVTPHGIDFYVGRNVVNINEDKLITWNGEVCGGIQGVRQKVLSAAIFNQGITQVMNNINDVYENFDSIMEIDFAKNIESNINTGLKISVIKGKNLIANRINAALNENRVFEFEKATGLKKFVYESISFDISESFIDILDEEQKIIVSLEKESKRVLEQISNLEGELKKITSAKAINENVRRNSKVLEVETSIKDEIGQLKVKFTKINDRIKLLREELDGTRNPLSQFSPGVKVQMKGTGEKGTLLSINETNNKLFVLLETGKQIECATGDLSVIDSMVKFHDGAQKDDVSVKKHGSVDSNKKKVASNSLKESASKLFETTRQHASSNDIDNSDQLTKRAVDKVEGINLNPSMFVKHPDYGDVLDHDIEGFEASAKAGEEMEGDPSALFNYDGVQYTQPEEVDTAESPEGFEEFNKNDPDTFGGFDDSEELVDDNPIEIPDELQGGFGFTDSDDKEGGAESSELEEFKEDGSESEESETEEEKPEESEESKESETEEQKPEESEESEEEKSEKSKSEEDEETKDEEDEEDKPVQEAIDLYRWIMESDEDDDEEQSYRPSGEETMDISFEMPSDDDEDKQDGEVSESEHEDSEDPENENDEDELSGSYGGAIEQEDEE